MPDTEIIAGLKFIMEHYGGSAAVIVMLIYLSWKWGKRDAENKSLLQQMQKDILRNKEDFDELNLSKNEDHKEFRSDINEMKIHVAELKAQVGLK